MSGGHTPIPPPHKGQPARRLENGNSLKLGKANGERMDVSN